MPRVCTICSHPERDAIEREVLAGRPFRTIAASFSLSRASLLRHCAGGHLSATLVQSARVGEITRADDLVARLIGLARETQAVLARARAAGDDELVLKAVARAEKQLELQARLIGELKEGTTINITLSAEWLSLQATIVAALDPWPEARLAVAAALEGGARALARN